MGSAEEVIASAKEAGLNEKALEADLKESKSAAAALAKSCRKVFGLQAGAAAVVTNGRAVPLAGSDALVAEDFELLTLHANAAQVAIQVNVPPHPKIFDESVCTNVSCVVAQVFLLCMTR